MAENQTTAAPETAAEPTAGRVTRIQGSLSTSNSRWPPARLYKHLRDWPTTWCHDEGRDTKKDAP